MKQAIHGGVPERRGERGFALLLVFLMAAAVALMLYQQIPRVAFESQREKEQLLIDHGQQYTRAIQLYFVAFKKYPSKIEDLENTNNKRFLRRRFIDPMTGKDEWRLIHVNAAGALTDSLVQKPPNPAQPGGSTTAGPGGATGAGGTTGNGGSNTSTNNATNSSTSPNNVAGTNNGSGANNGGNPNQPPEVNAAVLRRPSDRPLVSPNGLASNSEVDPNDPRYWPPITLVQPSGSQPGTQPPGVQYGTQPGVPPGAQQPGSQTGFQPGFQPGAQPTGLPPGLPGFQPGLTPGLPGAPSTGVNAQGQFGTTLPQPGATPQNPAASNPQYPNPNPNLPVYPPQVFPGQANPQQFIPAGQPGQQSAPGAAAPGTPGAPNAAIAAINSMLTTPRQAPATTPDAGGAVNAGGLAGVASTNTAPSIKVYKDRHKYSEWEFIFDLKTGIPGQQPAATPAPAQNGQAQGAPGQNASSQGTPGQNPGQSNSTFAPSTTFGPPSGSSTPAPPQQ